MWSLRGAIVGLLVMALVAPGSVAAAPSSANPDLVQIYFSRNPESLNDFTAVFPVTRDVAPAGQGVAGAAVQALIDGPTPAERAQGYFSDFGAIIVGGVSTCKGPDFVFWVQAGVATVQLCLATSSAGVGQDARAQAEIEATLAQFPGIQRVRVLSSNGHCLFDQSGLDLCLQP
jgi:hypothetical protein